MDINKLISEINDAQQHVKNNSDAIINEVMEKWAADGVKLETLEQIVNICTGTAILIKIKAGIFGDSAALGAMTCAEYLNFIKERFDKYLTEFGRP